MGRFLLYCVAFSTYFFFFNFVLRRVVAVALQGLSFFLLIVGTLLMAQYLRFSLLPALWRAARLVGVVC